MSKLNHVPLIPEFITARELAISSLPDDLEFTSLFSHSAVAPLTNQTAPPASKLPLKEISYCNGWIQIDGQDCLPAQDLKFLFKYSLKNKISIWCNRYYRKPWCTHRGWNSSTFLSKINLTNISLISQTTQKQGS